MTLPITSLIKLPFIYENPPPKGHDNCDQFPESLVRYFLKKYTKKKDKVFDPFIGFGTTALVAEEMGRIPFGIESDTPRFEWSAGQLEHWGNIINGDAGDMASFGFPKMDFCICSPPYMPINDKWNPLYGGDKNFAGYDAYLERLEYIFAALAPIMKRASHIVVQADNLEGKRYTPLVRDMNIAISKSLRPVGETIVEWDKAKKGYTHTHCMLFKKV